EPDLVRAEPGDTIKFVAVDKGHNAETVKGMLPEGVEGFKGKINEEVVFTVEAEGVYGIKCTPHYGMGMVALTSVREPGNLEEAKAVKHPGKAKANFASIFEELEATNWSGTPEEGPANGIAPFAGQDGNGRRAKVRLSRFSVCLARLSRARGRIPLHRCRGNGMLRR